MNIKVYPSSLRGNPSKVYSKSYMHRVIICCLLALLDEKDETYVKKKLSLLENFILKNGNDDVVATLNIALSILNHKPNSFDFRNSSFNCDDSASTVRMLVPLFLHRFGNGNFRCNSRLMKRLDIGDFFQIQDIFPSISISKDKDILRCDGNIKHGKFQFERAATSQVLSGLLMTLPCAEKSSTIIISEDFPSMDYVNITLNVMSLFSIKYSRDHVIYPLFNDKYRKSVIKIDIPGKQKYKIPNEDFAKLVEEDFSSYAYWICYNFIREQFSKANNPHDEFTHYPVNTGNIKYSLQGDFKITDILSKMKKAKLNDELFIDCKDIPDIVPLLALCAGSLNEVKVHLKNTGRLRRKESDRLVSTSEILKALNISCEILANELIIRGRGAFSYMANSSISSFGDHRIEMAAAIGIACSESFTADNVENTGILIKNAMKNSKSYIGFWDDFVKLGGKIDKL